MCCINTFSDLTCGHYVFAIFCFTEEVSSLCLEYSGLWHILPKSIYSNQVIDFAKQLSLYRLNESCQIPRATFTNVDQYCYLAPVPLSIFRSNSKFDENSECSSFEYTRPITTIFCTRHDSDTVVTCAKYRCDRPRILYTRVFWIFIEFRIRSKYA